MLPPIASILYPSSQGFVPNITPRIFTFFSFHVVRFLPPLFSPAFCAQNPPNFLRLPERSIFTATNFYPKLFLSIKKLLFFACPEERKEVAGRSPASCWDGTPIPAHRIEKGLHRDATRGRGGWKSVARHDPVEE